MDAGSVHLGRRSSARFDRALLWAVLCTWLAFGMRLVGAEDIGYHLLYGRELLETGRPVDRDLGLYLARTPSGEPARFAGELGPGNWEDAEGRYRFPNANWGSQLVLALVHGLGGFEALSVLRALLVLALGALFLAHLARVGLGALGAGAAGLVALLVVEERFWLRPELLGFVVLAAMLGLWGRALQRGRAPGGRAAIALVLLQLLFTNLHSYWPLGLTLTLAALAGAGVRALRVRRPAARVARARGELRTIALLGLGQLAACFLNPFGWRLVALPFQTFAFLRENDIGRSDAHPWSLVNELLPAFHARFASTAPTHALILALALTALGALAALRMRRLAPLLACAAFAYLALGMRRNIPIAGLVALPVALAPLAALLRAERRRRARPIALPRGARAALRALLLLACALLGAGAITQRYYLANGFDDRFGIGLSRYLLPHDALAWLRQRLPQGRVWTDFSTSSMTAFMLHPEREAPILTNTWAYPPGVLAELLAIQSGTRPWRERFDEHGVSVVLVPVEPATCRLHADPQSGAPLFPIVPALLREGDFALVYVDHRFALLARRAGPAAELAREYELRDASFDVEGFVERALAVDPAFGASLAAAGARLELLALPGAAAAVLRRAVSLDERDPLRWFALASVLARSSAFRLARGDPAGAAEREEARAAVRRCLALAPRHEGALRLAAELQRAAR